MLHSDATCCANVEVQVAVVVQQYLQRAFLKRGPSAAGSSEQRVLDKALAESALEGAMMHIWGSMGRRPCRTPTKYVGCVGTCRSDGENEYETEAEAALEEMDDAEMEERELNAMLETMQHVLQGALSTCRSEGENEYETEAEAALEEMDDAEMEERELEETEDLLEYYLQRAANTQSEAERLLAGARDLEESIGVSLSARRFEARCAAPAARRACLSTRSPCPPGSARRAETCLPCDRAGKEPCSLTLARQGRCSLAATCADRLPHACA